MVTTHVHERSTGTKWKKSKAKSIKIIFAPDSWEHYDNFYFHFVLTVSDLCITVSVIYPPMVPMGRLGSRFTNIKTFTTLLPLTVKERTFGVCWDKMSAREKLFEALLITKGRTLLLVTTRYSNQYILS